MSEFPGECGGSTSVRGGTHATDISEVRGQPLTPAPASSLPSPQPQAREPAPFREDAGCGGWKEAGRLALCQGGAGEALSFSLFWRRSQPRQPGPLPSSPLSSAAGEGREGAQGAPGEGLPLQKTGAKAAPRARHSRQWLPVGPLRHPWALPRWAGFPAAPGLLTLPPDTAGPGPVPRRLEPATSLGQAQARGGHTPGPSSCCQGSFLVARPGGAVPSVMPIPRAPLSPLPCTLAVSACFGPRGSQLTCGPCIFQWLPCLLCEPSPGEGPSLGPLELGLASRLWPSPSGACFPSSTHRAWVPSWG